MMLFITPCWRRLRLWHDCTQPGRGVASRALRWAGAWLRLAMLAPMLACGLLMAWANTAHSAEIEHLRLERQEQALLVHALIKLDLGSAVEDALAKGIAVYFVAEAELVRERWYWYDRKVAQVSRYYRLSYQALTRQWRLQASSEALSGSGSGSSITQSFDSLADALDVIRRQSGWKLVEASELEPETKQFVNYRFRLDISQLPRPFQITAGSQGGWSLNLARRLRVPNEAGN